MIKDNRKVAAVVITYNNAVMAKTLIEDLLNQTRMPDEIVVIDNSNNDLTEKILRKEFPHTTYIKMSENTGSAGGYYEGMRIALENNNDLIWTFDDDVRLLENSLAELLEGLRNLEKNDKMVGAVRGVGEGHKDTMLAKLDDFPWFGTLFKSAAIRKVGLPVKEYFMYGCDLEYSLRLAANNYHFFCVPASKIIDKRIGGKRKDKIFGINIFFYSDEFRLYYAFRNEIDIFKRYKLFFKIFKTFLYGTKLIMFFIAHERMKGLDKAKAVMNGFLDGLQSKLGKRKYLPMNEKK